MNRERERGREYPYIGEISRLQRLHNDYMRLRDYKVTTKWSHSDYNFSDRGTIK